MGCVYSKWCYCKTQCCAYSKCCYCKRHRRPSDGNRTGHGETGPCGGQGVPLYSERSLEKAPVPSYNFWLEYSVLTQKGYYPDLSDKENQDSYCIRTQLQGNPNIHFFGVFDGHGQFGSQCSNFVKNRLVEILANDPMLSEDPGRAYVNAFVTANEELHNSEIDDTMSGTTAITALVMGNRLYVANVGDSRAVIAVKDGNQIVAQDLSRDQTPFRKDEYERVKLCGARVLSADQVEGLKDPDIQTWGDEETEGNDPPRLWVQNGMYPGTAFTRSVGDSIAEKIGVIADPEVSVVQLAPSHQFFVVASDGVYEFLPSQAVVDMIARYSDPRDACSSLVGESYKRWLQNENRTDDITLIIAHIKGLSNSGSTESDGLSNADANPAQVRTSDVAGATGSEIHQSTEISSPDLQPVMSVDRNAAVVALSQIHSRPG